MKNLIYKAIMLFGLYSSISFGQEFLEPEPGMSSISLFSEYHVSVQKILLKDLGLNVIGISSSNNSRKTRTLYAQS